MKTFELTVEGKDYKIDIEKFDGKRAVVKIDGKPYEIDVKKAAEAVFPSPVASSPPSTPQTRAPTTPEPFLAPVALAPSGGEVIAPMPGLILEIMVAVGDHVVSGTPVLKMEAMKMENEIPSPVQGTVKTITVKEGDNVSTDETLMIIEEQG